MPGTFLGWFIKHFVFFLYSNNIYINFHTIWLEFLVTVTICCKGTCVYLRVLFMFKMCLDSNSNYRFGLDGSLKKTSLWTKLRSNKKFIEYFDPQWDVYYQQRKSSCVNAAGRNKSQRLLQVEVAMFVRMCDTSNSRKHATCWKCDRMNTSTHGI